MIKSKISVRIEHSQARRLVRSIWESYILIYINVTLNVSENLINIYFIK
jgi:hypothetical protein